MMPRLPTNYGRKAGHQMMPSPDNDPMILTTPRIPHYQLAGDIMGHFPLMSMGSASVPSTTVSPFIFNNISGGALPPADLQVDEKSNGSNLKSFNSRTQTKQQANSDMITLMRAKAKLANASHFPQEQSFNGLASIAATAPKKRTFEALVESEKGDESDRNMNRIVRKKSKKPSDMPRRALSAYNIFFSEQRKSILREIDLKKSGKSENAEEEEQAQGEKPSVMNRTFFPKREKRAHRKVHGKIGLVSLAKTVSQRWKELSPEKRKYYQDLADEDKERHREAMADYQDRKAAESMEKALRSAPGYDNNIYQRSITPGMTEMLAQQMRRNYITELMALQYQQMARSSFAAIEPDIQPRPPILTAHPTSFGMGLPSFDLHPHGQR